MGIMHVISKQMHSSKEIGENWIIKNKFVYPEIQFLMIWRNMIVVQIADAGIQDNHVLCNRYIDENTR